MSVAFKAAWMVLKNVRGGPTGRRMPMTEEESYGDVSFREHPLHGLEDDDESIDDSGSMPPMSRTLGGTPPPNIGRAGSTDEMPMGEPPNPFPKPLASRVQDQLAEFADGAGRRAAMKPEIDYSDAEEEDYGEEMDAKLAPFVGEAPKDGISDPHPEAHNIASRNIRETPRKTKRGQIDEPRATPRMQGRAARSPSPFVGGQPRSYFFGE